MKRHTRDIPGVAFKGENRSWIGTLNIVELDSISTSSS